MSVRTVRGKWSVGVQLLCNPDIGELTNAPADPHVTQGTNFVVTRFLSDPVENVNVV